MSFTLDSTAPVVTWVALVSDTGSSSTDRITSEPSLKGVGAAGAVGHDRTGRGQAARHNNGRQRRALDVSPSGLTEGGHTLTATQAGSTRTASLSFTLDRTAPVVTMASCPDTGSSASDKSPRTRRSRAQRKPTHYGHDQAGHNSPWHDNCRQQRRSGDSLRPGSWLACIC